MDVSIIIPVYNVAPYIGDCLRSVMRQSYKGDVECILVDDCGLDESIVIAEQMIAEYDGPIQFKILHHDHNRGLSAARNTGTLQAKGDWIYYLDSDDEITEDCIEKMMTVVSEYPGVEVVQGKYCKENQDALPVSQKNQLVHAVTNKEARECLYYHRQVPYSAWNKLLKREMISQHQILFKEGALYEDVLWLFLLLRYVSNAYFIPDITYHYRKRQGSICTATDKQTSARHYCMAFEDIINQLTPGHESEEIKFYGIFFSKLCLSYAHYYPSMKEVSLMYLKYAWKLRCFTVGRKLVVYYILGRYRFGRMVLTLLVRLKHPRLIISDLQRVFKRLKRFFIPFQQLWPRISDVCPSRA